MEGKVWVDDFFVYVDEQDKDFDGISAGREAQLGTSPTRADSDYDGLTDSQEIDSYGTDPLKADSDGDSLPDGLEVTAGGDPTKRLSFPPCSNQSAARVLILVLSRSKLFPDSTIRCNSPQI